MDEIEFKKMVVNLFMASLQIQQEVLSELNQMKSQLVRISVNTNPPEEDEDAEAAPYQTLNGPIA